MEEMADSHPSPVAAFRRRERGQKPKSPNAGGGMGRKRKHSKAQPRDDGGGDEDDEAVEKKIMELQRIVPGGKWVGVENLFEQTATYILALQCQVKAMNAAASFFDGLNAEEEAWRLNK